MHPRKSAIALPFSNSPAVCAILSHGLLRGERLFAQDDGASSASGGFTARERAAMQTKIEAAEKRAAESEAKYRAAVAHDQMVEGLARANVRQTARGKVAKLLAAESQVELDHEGSISSVVYGGVTYGSAAEAAAAYVRENAFLVDPAAASPAAYSDATAEECCAVGLANPARTPTFQMHLNTESLLAAGLAARARR